MPIAVPGSGESNHELQRRISELERTLGNYESIWVTVELPGGGKQQIEVIARRGDEETGLSSLLTLTQGTAADKFQVVSGYVNSLIPTLGGVPINSPVSPATTPATPEIIVTEDTYVWAKCVGTFGSPDTHVVTIETSATATVPAGTAITVSGFVSYFSIGRVDFTSGSPDTFSIINFHSGGNLGVESFGNVNLWWTR